jgi:predicted DNA-binding protein (MmcQ/YjbR family)
MDIEQVREYCLNFKGVTEELPFGPDVLVFKVMNKMFCLMPLNGGDMRVSLKNTPEKNIELRAEYPFITGAFHMSKIHWSSLDLTAYVKDTLVKELASESYELVVRGLPKKVREELNTL